MYKYSGIKEFINIIYKKLFLKTSNFWTIILNETRLSFLFRTRIWSYSHQIGITHMIRNSWVFTMSFSKSHHLFWSLILPKVHIIQVCSSQISKKYRSAQLDAVQFLRLLLMLLIIILFFIYSKWLDELNFHSTIILYSFSIRIMRRTNLGNGANKL